MERSVSIGGARRLTRYALLLALVAALASAMACNTGGGNNNTPDYESYLYMTDTVSGKVYAYDPSTHAAQSASYASTGQNATGEIQFYAGIGYAAVGSGTKEGVYYFDPSATNPTFTKLGASIAAQYFVFYSSTKAFVSSYGAGLYSFDPSSPSSGLTTVSSTAGYTLQELVLGSDGYIYAADNGNGAVLKLSADGTLAATITTTTAGTTGLVPGTHSGVAGVFVANTGGYDSTTYASLPGSIDFIAAGSSAVTTIATLDSSGDSIYPARLVQLSNGNLIATGYSHTYLVDLSGTSAVVTELSASGSSFGSLDIAYKDGLLYVPVANTSDYVNYTNYLYVFDASGTQESYSPVSVMSSSEGITNIGFYE